MNKQEYLDGLRKMNLPKEEFIILSGGSLLLRGIRKKASDYDFCFSDKLAKKLDLANAPKDGDGFYVPFEKCQVMDEFNKVKYDTVEGYKCESLDSILELKRKLKRTKDLVDIKAIEDYLSKGIK